MNENDFAKIKKMVSMQHGFNASLHEQYNIPEKNPERVDLFAIVAELGEMLEHLNYKWWKKGELQSDQAKMEVVDLLHFVMSAGIVAATDVYFAFEDDTLEVEDHYKATDYAIECNLAFMCFAKDNVEDITQMNGGWLDLPTCDITAENTYELKNIVASFLGIACAVATFDAGAFPQDENREDEKIAFQKIMTTYYVSLYQLASALGMSFDDLFLGYVGKNLLNRFRQQNGYKQGTYIKIWNGQEDNEVLTEMLKLFNKIDQIDLESLEEMAFNGLQEKYNIVKEGAK